MLGLKNQDDVKVCIQKSTYETLDLDFLLNPLGGIKNYVNKDEQVLLKVNLLNATPAEKAVVTNPELVKKTAEHVIKAGGIPYIGDSPSGQFTKGRLKRVYKKSGLQKISDELNIELNYDTKTTKIQVPFGKKLKETPVSNFVLKADKIISLPKIKTHSFMIMTVATKNMFGIIPGLTKAKYHSIFFKKTYFADMILDVLSIAPPDLIIVDGIIGMQGEGPSGGIPVNLGVILAAENSIALDITVCDILNIEPVVIPVLKQAKIRNLWPKQILYPQLKPIDVKYFDFVLPSTADYLITGKKTPRKSPVVTSRCTSCGMCQEICPKQAIAITNNQAQINHEKCIRCYCCHEVCPEKAIELKTL
ncbi:MAG: DUF362 domain-containing protein [Thermoplasmatota archaeon]|jgi:uncharacterized protein (DUF362 family)